MARILLTWELGSNLGHLSRLLPVASGLKRHGHAVLIAAREVAAAASLLGPAGIPFVQAPVAVLRSDGAATQRSYADLLSARGWGDANHLWGLVHAWVNLIRQFAPEVIVFDHSPTALLAARASSAHRVLIGTGFELPPRQVPLPPFPGIAGIAAAEVAGAEASVLENANRVLRSLHAPELENLAQLFDSEQRYLTTVAELDHYGRREERYVGPIGALERGATLQWPSGVRERVFAYLRPDTPGLPEILRGLAAHPGAVICCIPGLSSLPDGVKCGGDFVISERPVRLDSLLPETTLCVSYAPAGTVTSTLLCGVPQLLAPAHVEAQLTAQRVEALGAGLTLRGKPDESSVTSTLQRLLATFDFTARARTFAQKYREFERSRATDQLVAEIGNLAAQGAR